MCYYIKEPSKTERKMRPRTKITRRHIIDELLHDGSDDEIRFHIHQMNREIDYRETINDIETLDMLEEWIMELQMEQARRNGDFLIE